MLDANAQARRLLSQINRKRKEAADELPKLVAMTALVNAMIDELQAPRGSARLSDPDTHIHRCEFYQSQYVRHLEQAAREKGPKATR